MIEILRKSYIALAVLALALIAQIPHAAYVFDAIPYIASGNATTISWSALGYSYAIALELAVLMFVVHGKQAESYGFAFASVLVNLSYYAMHDVALFSSKALPAWLISFMLPVAIARYSHIIAQSEDVAMSVQWFAWVSAIWPSRVIALPDATPNVLDIATPDALPNTTPDALPNTTFNALPDAAPDMLSDPKARALQLRSKGLRNSQIAAQLNVNPSTVGRWFAKVTALE